MTTTSPSPKQSGYCTTCSTAKGGTRTSFGGRRHLFKADGFHLNRSGAQLLSNNIFYLLCHKLAAPVKDKTGQDVPKQQITECSGESAEKDPAMSSPPCQRGESSPATTGDTQPSTPLISIVGMIKLLLVKD